MVDFELGLGQSGEAATVEQFRFEAAPKRLGVDVVATVAPPAHALQRALVGEQDSEAGSRVVAALVGVDDKPGRGPAYHKRASQGLAD